MAENFAAWTSPTWVRQTQVNFSNLSTKYNESSSLIKDMSNDIKAIIKIVEKEEERFYRMFGIIDRVNPLAELERRVAEVNNDPGFRSMIVANNGPYLQAYLAAIMERVDYSKIPFRVLREEVSKETYEALRKNTDETGLTGIAVAKLFKEIGESRNLKTNSKKNITKVSGNTSVTKLAAMKLTPQKRNKKPTTKEPVFFDVVVDATEGMSSHWKTVFPKRFKIDLPIQQNPYNTLRELLKNKIQNSELRRYVLYELDKRSSYSLENSEASIKGFLGEVHFNALIRYLTRNSEEGIAEIRRTGKLYNKIKGQSGQISIDSVVNGIGFQIKNYSEAKNGTVKLGNLNEKDRMAMGNFIQGRMRPIQSVEEVLLTFFGSYQFNRPIPDATLKYQKIYENFSKIINNSNGENGAIDSGDGRLKQIFDAYTHNIMRVSQQIKTTNKWFNGKIYFNSFFKIGNRFIPSSRILAAIYNKMNNNSETIISSYTIDPPPEIEQKTGGDREGLSSKEKKGKGTKEQNKTVIYIDEHTLPSKNAKGLADYIKINYNFSFNIEEILKEALNGLG